MIDSILDQDSRDGMESQGQSHINSTKSSDSKGLNKEKPEFRMVKNGRDAVLMTVKFLQV